MARTGIIVTELPYQVNKSSLIERIAELVRDGGSEGITDLQDESDRQGLRIVIELTKNVEPEKVLTACINGPPCNPPSVSTCSHWWTTSPACLNLKQALRVYLDHRLMVINGARSNLTWKRQGPGTYPRRTDGRPPHLDEIIALIRRSPGCRAARDPLDETVQIIQLQANAILEMQLRRLAALERKKIETEYKETLG